MDCLSEIRQPTLAPAKLEKIAFPKTLGEQSQAIRNMLKTVGKPLSSTEIGGYFKGAKKDRVSELLEGCASPRAI